MAKNYHINKEIDSVVSYLTTEGLDADKRISKKGVPYVVVENKISLCFFWRSKQWKVFDWLSADNRTITQKSVEDIKDFVKDYFLREAQIS